LNLSSTIEQFFFPLIIHVFFSSFFLF